MKGLKKILSTTIAALVPFLFCAVALANDPCEVPDNGSGTVDLPADCPYTAPYEPMYIIDGLPLGTTIELDPILDDYLNIVRTPGGTLGGEIQQFDATLDLTVSGTGDLSGFNRHLAVPVSLEVHTGPRNPGDPVQAFTAVVYRLQGELFGDPDFCTFRVRGGTDYGLPSPGFTTLTELLSGNFDVDSFFDITYQIEFEGCPGSVLEDYMGTTTATVRWQQGVSPVIGACCKQDGTCIVAPETYCQHISGTYHGDGSSCLGDGDGDGYDDLCFEPGTCLAPNNGSGTVDLPADCPYTAPYEPMYIIDGLPTGTTIELEPTFDSFFCDGGTPCSLSMPPSVCEGSGGSLGGNYHCFEATLNLDVSGTGDLTGFNRHLAVPVSLEVHTGPRTPGDPVQSFPDVLFRLQGELFGDPDFCTFRVRGGTDNGLPGPGQTSLTALPGGYYNVDSFFDITYQIEFEGCPDSQLADYAGTTTATVRWQQGAPSATGACCRQDGTCVEAPETYCQGISGNYNGDGSACLGDGDGDGYDDLCVSAGCCLAPDSGIGTVDLPADCPYTAPYEPMYIIDGLPTGTTIELEPTFDSFFCDGGTPCSLSMPPSVCEGSGGSLGGNYHCFEATLDLDVSGTGDLTGFNRHLAVSMVAEVHTAPRTPGDPVQTFLADMYRLQGELFGDPDFCTFRVTGGTNYGLPSPGQTTLTKRPEGNFTIDSFFDITYQIEFEGCPDSQLADYAGTTTATVRWQQGLRDDGDCDGAPADEDTCPDDYNPGQEDTYPPGGNSNPPSANCGDACECEGDFDTNGVVDGIDAITFKADFGRFNCALTFCNGDFDCNGVVDGLDAIQFKKDFGRFDCPDCATDPWCGY